MAEMSNYRWMVVNQSQSPVFQSMLGRLADKLGPCLLITGMPHPNQHANLTVKIGPKYVRDSMRSRMYSWFQFSAFASRQILRYRNDLSLIFSVTNPPMLPHISWALTRGKKAQTGILVWDLYPEHIVQQGWASETAIAVRAWTRMNRRVLADASVVITLGQRMANALGKQMNGKALHVDIIPNWADTDLLKPISKSDNPFAVEHGLTDKTVVLYSGNIGGSHTPDALVDAAILLKDDSRVQFVIIGDGLGASSMDKKIEEHQLQNVTRLPFQPWEKLPLSLGSGDISVVTQSAGSAELSVPSKTYSYMATGSALLAITDINSDLADLVRNNNVGVVCSTDTTTGVADMIRAWLDSPEHLSEQRKNARALCLERFSEQQIDSQFYKLLRGRIN